ncbi:porin [Sinorhizobium sp. BG8]|uniref:porin n=1 Tax=Sinorhizobium sp. BG8 TaxID=2613773 RepID=UPI00193E7EDC|nr:porin [Sinorhizobium sp. BG8]QRM54807.1 porin [Sinorhizobium sp. BG8]
MNIKSLLLGSAAALAAVSGAQAADAIVAAEPEPMEYVRVCDAFGAGYFYIPGTETCLKVGGYLRVQLDISDDVVTNDEDEAGYKTNARGYLIVNAKSDTEYGVLNSEIDMQMDSQGGFFLDGAFIQLGGLTIGRFYNYWDAGLSGETDINDSGASWAPGAFTLNDAIMYTYDGGTFNVSGTVENFEPQGATYVGTNPIHAPWKNFGDVGLSAKVGFTFGGISANLIGSYDTWVEEGAIRALATADIGPGTFGIFGVWSSDPSRYWNASEWSVAAEYKAKINDKFSITPGVQWFDKIDIDYTNGSFQNGGHYAGDGDAWRAGVTVDYAITAGLTSKLSVQYQDEDHDEDVVGGGLDDKTWSGFLRLQRDF